MNQFLRDSIIKMFVRYIEGYIGKVAKKFTVNVQDEGEAGFTVTIKVFDSLNSVISKASSTLSGLISKGGKK